MKVMRRLRAGPDGQLSIRILDGHRSMLLDGKVRTALVEENVLEDLVSLGKTLLHIAECERHSLVNISFIAVIVNPRLGSGEGFFGIRYCRQNFVFDINQIQSLEGS